MPRCKASEIPRNEARYRYRAHGNKRHKELFGFPCAVCRAPFCYLYAAVSLSRARHGKG